MTLSHSLQPIHSNLLSESHSIHRRWTRCFCQDLLSNYQAEVSRRGRNHVFRTSKIKINGFCNLALSSVVTLRVLGWLTRSILSDAFYFVEIHCTKPFQIGTFYVVKLYRIMNLWFLEYRDHTSKNNETQMDGQKMIFFIMWQLRP